MSSSKPRTVAPQDPRIAIEAQARYNRVGQRNPFGSALYETNPDGSAVVNTDLSPGMNALIDRQGQLAMTDSNRARVAPGLSMLASALMQNYGRRRGLSADQLGTIDLSHGMNSQLPQMPSGRGP